MKSKSHDFLAIAVRDDFSKPFSYFISRNFANNSLNFQGVEWKNAYLVTFVILEVETYIGNEKLFYKMIK